MNNDGCTHAVSHSLVLRRALATSVALTTAGWGVFALPAAADPGNGNGNGNGVTQSQAANNPSTKDPKGPKGNNGHHNGHGQGQGQGQGPKDGKGNDDKSDDAKGPKGNGQAGSQAGGNGDPAGNNGTVKITPHLEDDGIPQNSPHATCIFDIEWYGFDEGADIISTVEFAMQAPTSDVVLSGTEPSTVFVGGDPASGAGTDSGFDGEATYTLAFEGEPHPQQGYHVALTVHTPRSQGADTKHKVFWVEPCATEPAAAGTETFVEESVELSAGADSAETSDEMSDQAGAEAPAGSDDATREDAAADDAAAAAGDDAGAADVPNAVDAGEGSLVRNLVTSPLGLLVIALGLALAGAALVARRRTA